MNRDRKTDQKNRKKVWWELQKDKERDLDERERLSDRAEVEAETDRGTQNGCEERSRNIQEYTKTQKTECRREGNPAGAESQSGTKIKDKCCQR